MLSVKVQTAVWEGFSSGGSELLVMLALSDWADDEGRCWPSIAKVAEKCRLSRSQVQRVVHRLIAGGHLFVEANAAGGAPGATRRYRIDIASLARAKTARTGRADATGRVNATCSINAQHGSHRCAETGRVDATQTTTEPSVDRQQVNSLPQRPQKLRKDSRVEFDARAQFVASGVDQQVVTDFLTLRKVKRAPVTATVIADIAHEAAKAGITVEKALRTCCVRGWQTFQADWHTGGGQRSIARRAPAPENFDAVDYGRGGKI